MKIVDISNTDKFLKAIDECVGKVELVTSEGDRLNLKSKLSQFVTLTKIFNCESMIKDIELVVYKPEDVNRLLKFLICS